MPAPARLVRWVLSISFALLAALPAGARAAEEAVAVLPLEIAGGIMASRQALEGAVGRGVAGAGRPVIFAEAAAERLAGKPALAACREAGCWRQLGKLLGAAHLLFGRVEKKEGEFHATFQMVAAAAGQVIDGESGRCDENDCSVAELARKTAADLSRRALAKPLPPALVERAPLAPAVPPPPWRRAAPYATLGVGVATLAVGLVVLKLHGDCVESAPTYKGTTACLEEKRYLTAGLIETGVGAALAAAGAYWVLRDRQRGYRLELAVTPGGLRLGGHF